MAASVNDCKRCVCVKMAALSRASRAATPHTTAKEVLHVRAHNNKRLPTMQNVKKGIENARCVAEFRTRKYVRWRAAQRLFCLLRGSARPQYRLRAARRYVNRWGILPGRSAKQRQTQKARAPVGKGRGKFFARKALAAIAIRHAGVKRARYAPSESNHGWGNAIKRVRNSGVVTPRTARPPKNGKPTPRQRSARRIIAWRRARRYALQQARNNTIFNVQVSVCVCTTPYRAYHACTTNRYGRLSQSAPQTSSAVKGIGVVAACANAAAVWSARMRLQRLREDAH